MALCITWRTAHNVVPRSWFKWKLAAFRHQAAEIKVPDLKRLVGLGYGAATITQSSTVASHFIIVIIKMQSWEDKELFDINYLTGILILWTYKKIVVSLCPWQVPQTLVLRKTFIHQQQQIHKENNSNEWIVNSNCQGGCQYSTPPWWVTMGFIPGRGSYQAGGQTVHTVTLWHRFLAPNGGNNNNDNNGRNEGHRFFGHFGTIVGDVVGGLGSLILLGGYS